MTGGIRDENEKIPDYGRLNTRRTATLTRRDRDKHSEWGRIAGLRDCGIDAKRVVGFGIEKASVIGPSSI